MIKWLSEHFEEMGGAALLFIMAAIAFANVLTRYVINYSISFTEELTVYFFVWMTFLGLALAFRRGTQVRVTFFASKFSKPVRKALVIAAAIACVTFFAAMGYYGVLQVMDEIEMGAMTESMSLPVWWFSASIPVGSLLIVIRIIQKLAEDLRTENY